MYKSVKLIPALSFKIKVRPACVGGSAVRAPSPPSSSRCFSELVPTFHQPIASAPCVAPFSLSVVILIHGLTNQ
ncbi:hypothetical protein EYF80_064844 [Liparis tanakae]|uniref:Uncharacterized protein n=1 Tax=Liparis tanakae TaxID=230148 RepID=A0A4Z2E8A7_9TELE|nr:hypothetical protein EYF80_064844 [Liparis tanakae]